LRRQGGLYPALTAMIMKATGWRAAGPDGERAVSGRSAAGRRPTFLVRARLRGDHDAVTVRSGDGRSGDGRRRPGARGRLAVLALVLVVAAGALVVLVRAGLGHGGGTHETAADLPAVAPPPVTAAPTATPTKRARPRAHVKVVTGPAGQDVHGIVVDASNNRLPGVHVAYDESLPDAPGFRPVAVTDAGGRFAVPCESRNVAPRTPPLLFSTYDGASGLVDPKAPNIAWVEIAQQCGRTGTLGVRVTMTQGATLTGTLYQHGDPARTAGLRVGVECDEMPRGNVNAFYAQVSAAVDPHDGTFRVTGLRTDRCAVGVFDRPHGAGREVVLQVDVTAGQTTHLDVHDDGQDHFPGKTSGQPSASPTPTPSSTCLAVCSRRDVPDRA
jgi:hypothetical protein